ncbi:hypothetical protein [Aridibaculum aurantiacum]|uniref:hypothetical protein n=1 Tax=Aridibaculum aurantiacum TaxID=2810307 RepID=UPI001A97AB5C|nr:hypothetical protein [Aridibaculum aurantiacum]
MPSLLFLARTAFICNLFFLLCILFKFWEVIGDQALAGFIIIVGWVMAPLLNLVFNVVFVIAFYKRKQPLMIPKYIIGFNVIIQLLQFIFIPFV